jgi:DNA polymerase-3 subunit delta
MSTLKHHKSQGVSLNRREFDNRLAQRDLPNALLLFGQSHFLIDHYIHASTQQLGSAEEIITILGAEYLFDQVKTYLYQPSLFASKSIVVVKSDKVLPKKDLQEFITLVLKHPENYFIYAYFGEDFKKVQSNFGAKKTTVSLRLFHPFEGEAINWLNTQASKLNLPIERHLLAYLYHTQNSDLSFCFNELEKLSLLKQPITKEVIDTHVFSYSEFSFDDLFIQILQRKPFIPIVENLLQSGSEVTKIITSFSRFITQITLFHLYIKTHGVANSIDILGFKLPKKIEEERAKIALQHKLINLHSVLTILLKTEKQLKSDTASDKEAILIHTLIKIKTKLE